MTRARRAKGAAQPSRSKSSSAAAARPSRSKSSSAAAARPAAAVAVSRRRAVFIDVENTSSKTELLHTLDGLALAGDDVQVEVTAIGNWRVIGQDLGRALAERGAQLVHSAPVSRVPDWSDLWIAVSAGIWLGNARAGDVLEIVSHDRAFDAVGDAAARLGVAFRRVTYRAVSTPSRKRATCSHEASVPAAEAVTASGGEPVAASTDRLRQTIGELTSGSQGEGVSLDVLTRALKSAGFQRPTGSPRLVNRLRRMKDVEVTRGGRVRFIGAGRAATADREAKGASPEASTQDVASPARRRRSSRRRGGRRRGRRGKGAAATS